MPPKITLYIGPTQEATWERAREIAAETRRSLSQITADALVTYVAEHDSTTGRISDRDRAVRTILLHAAAEIERSIGGETKSVKRTTKKTGRRTR